MIEICAVGGYNEVGKNMTAVRVDDDVILLDMGLYLESYINYTENEDLKSISAADLIKVGAIPDINQIKSWRNNVRAIVTTHAHLDHLGAIPFLASRFDAPVFGTPFALAVLKKILKDNDIKINNELKQLNTNSVFRINKNIQIEFINMTHSTPQTVMVAIHTRYGTILYANDFKFDDHPVVGKKPDYERLRQLKVIALVVDSIYSGYARKTPSESVAKEMLRDVLMNTDASGKLIVVTTFSSHIARLKTIASFARELDRKVVFLGRSLAKYASAAQGCNIISFNDVEIVKFSSKIKQTLDHIQRKRSKYLIVVTGHQGEPNSVLMKMLGKEFNFVFEPEDHVIFSCTVIPSPMNQANREKLEQKLKEKKVRIFKDIHVSGHASREDLRDLIKMVHPTHIIPAHADAAQKLPMVELAEELGYVDGKTVHMMRNGQTIRIS